MIFWCPDWTRIAEAQKSSNSTTAVVVVRVASRQLFTSRLYPYQFSGWRFKSKMSARRVTLKETKSVRADRGFAVP
jgi:hypothetical protein